MLFAKKLDRLMRMKGETQRSLGAALELSHRAIGGWLNDSKPHRSTALLLAEHFGVPVDDLLDDDRDLPFEKYLNELKAASDRAQAAYPGNEPAQQHAFDVLLAERNDKRTAQRLRKVIAELADIAYGMDPKDIRLHEISQAMRQKQP